MASGAKSGAAYFEFVSQLDSERGGLPAVNTVEAETVETEEATREEEEEEIDEEERGSDRGELIEAQHAVPAKSETETTEHTDDLVRIYMRDMRSVELLSREGEISIAKRIEAGREAVIVG